MNERQVPNAWRSFPTRERTTMLAAEREVVSSRPAYVRTQPLTREQQEDPDAIVIARRSSIFERVTFADGDEAMRCLFCGALFDHIRQATGHYVGSHHAVLGKPPTPVLEACRVSALEPRHDEPNRRKGGWSTVDDSSLLAEVRRLLGTPEASVLQQRVAELEDELATLRRTLRSL